MVVPLYCCRPDHVTAVRLILLLSEQARKHLLILLVLVDFEFVHKPRAVNTAISWTFSLSKCTHFNNEKLVFRTQVRHLREMSLSI